MHPPIGPKGTVLPRKNELLPHQRYGRMLPTFKSHESVQRVTHVQTPVGDHRYVVNSERWRLHHEGSFNGATASEERHKDFQRHNPHTGQLTP